MAIHPEKKRAVSVQQWLDRPHPNSPKYSITCVSRQKKTGCLSTGAVVRIIAVQGAIINFFT